MGLLRRRMKQQRFTGKEPFAVHVEYDFPPGARPADHRALSDGDGNYTWDQLVWDGATMMAPDGVDCEEVETVFEESEEGW